MLIYMSVYIELFYFYKFEKKVFFFCILLEIFEYLIDFFKVLKLIRMEIRFDWNIFKWNAEFFGNKLFFVIK